jgi:MFS transporter, DHA1 family, tetracycline resistance protein
MIMNENTVEKGPAAKASLALIFVIVFIDLLGFAIVLPLLPRYAKKFGATPLEIGLLFASFSAMQFIFAPLWGRLSDRVGRRPVLLCGLLGSVVFYALFAVATMQQQLALMFLARIGAGIAGATISTAQAYIADATGMEGRAKGMALIGAAFGIGFTFGPILGSISLPGNDTHALNYLPGFLASGLSFIALTVAWIKLPESLHTGAAPAQRSWLNIAAMKNAISIPTVGLLLLLFFITTFAFAQFESTISLLTERAFGMSEKSNFYLFTYIGVTLSIMQGIIVRRLAPVLKEGRMIVIGTLLLSAGMWLVSVAAVQGSPMLLMLTIPVLVGGFSFVTPSAQALISRRSDPARQGEVMGINQSASAMARILGPICGHKLLGHATTLPYQVAAGLVVPAIILAILTANTGHDWQQK